MRAHLQFRTVSRPDDRHDSRERPSKRLLAAYQRERIIRRSNCVARIPRARGGTEQKPGKQNWRWSGPSFGSSSRRPPVLAQGGSGFGLGADRAVVCGWSGIGRGLGNRGLTGKHHSRKCSIPDRAIRSGNIPPSTRNGQHPTRRSAPH